MKPLLYQRSSNGMLGLAFTATIAIYASALAFSPVQTPPPDVPSTGAPEIDFESVDPEPEPESSTPEPIEPTEQLAPPNDFYDTPEPTPRRLQKPIKPIRPMRPVATAPRSSGTNGKLFAILSPRPVYPYEARRNHVTGSGAVVLNVDSSTGTVLSAAISETSGSAMLDNSAVSAFRHWRFRTGTPSKVRIPFTFTMFGAQL